MAIDWKTASGDERGDEIERIAKEMGDHRFFTGKELRSLPKMLAHGEPVIAFVSGYMAKETWLVVLTDRRILMIDKNMFIGGEQISIALEKVSTVEAQTGLVFGDLRIEDSSNEHIVKNIMKHAAERFADKVREQMELRRVAPVAAAAPPDRYAQLERLDGLRKSGAVTEAEFEREKARLLG